MKLLKGIAVYTLIAIGAVICIGMILLGCMFLFQGKFTLFGYGFVYETELTVLGPNVVIETHDPTHSVRTINLNVKAHDGLNILVVADESATAGAIRLKTDHRYYGFYKDNSKLDIKNAVVSIDASDNSIMNVSFEVKGVDGAIFYNENCVMKVIVPRYVLDNNGIATSNILKYNLNLTSEDGDINVKPAMVETEFVGPIAVTSLNVKTNRGNLNIDGLANSQTSEDNNTVRFKNLGLETNAGRFDLTKLGAVEVEDSVRFNCKKGDFVFDELHVGIDKIVTSGGEGQPDVVTYGYISNDTKSSKLDIFGDNTLFDVNNLHVASSITYKSESGIFRIKNTLKSYLDQTLVESDSAEISVKDIKGGQFGAISSYGNITINSSTDSTYLENKHGEVKITGKCDAGLAVVTTYGNISVKEYTKSGNFSTERGKIDVTSTATGDDAKNYTTTITARKTSINLTTNEVPFNITTTDKCTVNVNVKKVLTPVVSGTEYLSKAHLKSGTLNVNLPQDGTQYRLIATGSLSGNIGTSYAGTDIQSGVEKIMFETNASLIGSKFDLKASNIKLS